MREVRSGNNWNLRIRGMVRSVSQGFTCSAAEKKENDSVSCAEGLKVLKIMDSVRRGWDEVSW